jgi:hypothetical protein
MEHLWFCLESDACGLARIALISARQWQYNALFLKPSYF